MQSTEANTKAGSLTEDGRDREIDILIQRRSETIGDPDAQARAWAESLQSYNMAAAVQRREAWAKYHARLARTHQQLAAEHEAAAAQLTGGW